MAGGREGGGGRAGVGRDGLPFRIVAGIVLVAGALWLPVRYGGDLAGEFGRLQGLRPVEGVVLRKALLRGGAGGAGGRDPLYLVRVRYDGGEASRRECELVVTADLYGEIRPGRRIRVLAPEEGEDCLSGDEGPFRWFRLLAIAGAVFLVGLTGFFLLLPAFRHGPAGPGASRRM